MGCPKARNSFIHSFDVFRVEGLKSEAFSKV